MTKTYAILAAAALASVAWGLARYADWCTRVDAAGPRPGRTSGTAPGRPDKPRAVLETFHVDLGALPSDTPLVARIPIHNDGSRRLIVRREGTGCCGLTDAPWIILPGETSDLQVTMDTAGRRGRLQLSTAFTTNDPNLPRFELTASAQIVESTD